MKIILIILLLISIKGYTQVDTTNHPCWGNHNVLIGVGAGQALYMESYCVVVGHDSIAKNIKGSDMLWYVDFNDEELLRHPKIVIALKVYKHVVGGKWDTPQDRINLVNKIVYIINHE